MYNSVAWNSGAAGFESGESDGNKVLGDVANTNLEEGPNFVDPSNTTDVLKRDYNIRPSFTLLMNSMQIMWHPWIKNRIWPERAVR